MPKIKVNPNPTQAKIILMLHRNQDLGLYLTYTGKGKVNLAGRNYSNQRAIIRKYGKPRGATLAKMAKEGWLCNRDFGLRMGALDYAWILSPAGREIAETLTDEDMISIPLTINTADVIKALRKKHPFPQWIFIEELRLGTGYGYAGTEKDGYNIPSQKRVDAWAMHCWKSKKYVRISYEVKVYRGDFINELKDPRKRKAALAISNLFYFAAPEGIIKPEELPDDCGLIEIRSDQLHATIVEARWRESISPSWPMIASIGRSLIREG